MLYQFEHFGISEHFCKEYGTNLNFPVHLHQSFELVTVLSGEMQVTVDTKVYTIRKNEGLLIFPHQLHSMKSTDCEHMLCICSPEIVKEYYTKYAGKVPVCAKFLLSDHSVDSLHRLQDESSKIKKKGVMYSICAEFDDNAEYITKKSDRENLLYRIFEFVEKNYKKDCSLERLSDDTGFSYHYLSRYFKSRVSITFNSYVNLYRISKACYILNNTDYTVIQCALECGYTSLRSFNRNFRLRTKLTPIEYRSKS
jgi:AraC-like DNA-binding protein